MNIEDLRLSCVHGKHGEHFYGHATCPGGRVPTQAEINALAVPDYDAAINITIKRVGPLAPDVLHVAWHTATHQIVDAALGGGT